MTASIQKDALLSKFLAAKLGSSLAKSHQHPILKVKMDIAGVFIAYSAI